MEKLDVKILVEDADFMPVYKTTGSACMDCRADILSTTNGMGDTYTIFPGQVAVIDLGFRVAVPEGYVMNVYLRSGIAANYSLVLGNGVGKIDSDYRGIVKAIVANIGTTSATISHKDRIAQCEIVPVHPINLISVPILDDTNRGEGGLGSTGVK